ncbi:class I SAM-dependent methyltransferase [Alicyclobacillus tolerans]|uniref:class I SAM-dependent methyltransferase n=1 Tax=Alicyclobacillus tolerans TaxID=90970 RepID=UPI003B7B42FE
MYSLQDLRDVIVALCDSPIVISPWLAYIRYGVDFESDVYETMRDEAHEFSLLHWNESYDINVFGTLPVSPRLPENAFYETAISTAYYYSYNQGKSTIIHQDAAKQAIWSLTTFIEQHGFDKFVSTYAYVTAYENYVALNYYGEMRELDFVFGKLHRPWITYTLRDELMFMHVLGVVEVFIKNNTRYIRLTDLGKQRFFEIQHFLDEVGFLSLRSNLLRISSFSELNDYDNIFDVIFPMGKKIRKQLLDLAIPEPGMKVLEFGCGSGSFTLESGLADTVGPKGLVLGIDPAPGLLAQANYKVKTAHKPWVQFVHGIAEHLPYADNTFDLVIGFASLHLTNWNKAIRELRRVLKKGGLFASAHPIHHQVDLPFFTEWFEPIFKLPGTTLNSSSMPLEKEIPNALQVGFSDLQSFIQMAPTVYAHPEYVVRFLIQSVDLYANRMLQLPWGERQKLFDHLIDRGQEILEKYSKEELTVDYPVQFVLAKKVE